MEISKLNIKNYRSIKDSGEILFTDKLFVLAGQNESGKSSILAALNSFQKGISVKENLNFELENDGNYIQEIRVTYSKLTIDFYSALISGIFELIKSENSEIKNLDPKGIFKEEVIKSIENFTITKFFDFSQSKLSITAEIDKHTLVKIGNALNEIEINNIENTGAISKIKKPPLDLELYAPDIADIFFKKSLLIVLFDDFQSLLPDKILLDDLVKNDVEGIKAVRNIEKLLKISFEDISVKSTPHKNSTTEKESASISLDFQKDWQQKIYGTNKVNIKFFIENNEQGLKEISFFVETKDNEYLSPRRRSKGMIWFLSLWLELKARENRRKLLLLFDEPGLHLHIKANNDLLKIFHNLTRKGHQIVYSTHSPSLIETDKLYNIGLVVNTLSSGTTVEGLTTSKINSENKREALQPIAEAMGMEPLKEFSVLKKRNVLLEGLSDFWYLNAMAKLLRPDKDYEFIPGIGIKGNKINHLISFCIGYGLDWVLVMDGGALPLQLKEELNEVLFNGDQTESNQKIKIVSVKEIEDLLHVKDLNLIDKSISVDTKKSAIEIIGTKRKILFSRLFMQKVASGEIKREHIQTNTIDNFEEIFNWIDEKFKK